MFGRKQEVSVGQFYRKLDKTGHVYEVLEIKTDPLGAVHVRLRRQDERSSLRTLAASVLLDPDEYELLS